MNEVKKFLEKEKFVVYNSFPFEIFTQGKFVSSFISIISPLSNSFLTALCCSKNGCFNIGSCIILPISEYLTITYQEPYMKISDTVKRFFFRIPSIELLETFLSTVHKHYNTAQRNGINAKTLYPAYFPPNILENRIPKGITQLKHLSEITFKPLTHFKLSATETLDDPVCCVMMLDVESKFRSYNNLNIYILQWNVDQFTSPEKFQSYFEVRQDIYVISLQEVDMSAEGIIKGESPKKEQWIKDITTALNTLDQYKCIACEQKGSCLLALFVKYQVLDRVTDVVISSLPLGTLDFWNKGAIALHCYIDDTPTCFVCSHLIHGRSEVEKRNIEVNKVLETIEFPTDQTIWKITSHDAVFWAGDFNYRLELDDNESRQRFNDRDFLLQYDQLIMEMKKGNVFSGFTEPPITFNPTYKYNRGTCELDSVKKRGPAWCDRILYCQGLSDTITPIRYYSIPEATISDHKPVIGKFILKSRTTNKEKANELYTVFKSNIQNMSWSVVADKKHVSFDALNSPQTITLQNKGAVPALFTASSADPWLSVSPSSGIIKANQSFNITLTIHRNPRPSKQQFTTLTINFVGNHPITFIYVSANLPLHIDGLPLEYLNRLQRPIAFTDPKIFARQDPTKPNTALINSFPKISEVPIELTLLTDEILKIAKSKNCFLGYPDENQVQLIKRKLEHREKPTGFEEQNLGAAFLSIIENFPHFIINKKCIETLNTIEKADEIYASLDQDASAFLHYFVDFISKLLSKSQISDIDKKSLITNFASHIVNPKDFGTAELINKWITLFTNLINNSN